MRRLGQMFVREGKRAFLLSKKDKAAYLHITLITGLCFNLNESFFHLKDKVVAIAIVLQVKES